MHRLTIVLLFFIATPGLSQTEISWQTLTDVRFTDRYSEEEEAYYYYPHFGSSVKALEGQEVILRGYMLILGRKRDIFILSRMPYASCFFCGKGGPESIVELKMKPDHPKFRMDQVVTIKGKLRLNHDDVYQCNYILDDAEPYKED